MAANDPLLRDAMEQVERIAATPRFQQAESLSRLLRYLMRAASANPGCALREVQIAVDVFGKGPHFDSRSDSTVRVQMSRLRSRLAEYYEARGASDDLIIELPRGHYDLRIRRRSEPEAAVPPAPVEPAPPPAPSCPWWRLALAVLAGVVLGGGLMFVLFPALASLR